MPLNASVLRVVPLLETPVLRLHDLQGDIVATAALSETETKLSSTYNSTEFGVQVNGTPPTKYSWLGATGASSELSSGTLVEGTVAYQPQLGRALQTQAVIPPGMAVNGATQTVAYHSQVSAWEITSGNTAATRHAEEGAAEEAAAQREAEEKVLRQCREEGGCGTEEGDPCGTVFENERYDLGEGAYLSAWVTISWCWNGHKVLSASVKNRGHYQKNSKGVLGTLWRGCKFFGWIEKAEWRGNVYYIQRIARFDSIKHLPASPVSSSPVHFYFLDIEFLLYPGGLAFSKAVVELRQCARKNRRKLLDRNS